MKRTGSMAWCLGLAAVTVSVAAGHGFDRVVVAGPAVARRGIVTFFVAGDSSIRPVRPIDSAVMPGLIRRAEQLICTRIRVVLSPGVPWGVVQTLARLDETALDVELHPAAARSELLVAIPEFWSDSRGLDPGGRPLL